MTWGKRKDGQAYKKDKKGMSGSKLKTNPTSDIHMKQTSMNINRENVWDRISEIPEIIQADIRPNADKFIDESEMDIRGMNWCKGVLDWCDGEFDLEVNNINWIGDYIETGKGYNYEIHRVQKLVMESAMYWVDKAFGYEEETERRPTNKSEEMVTKVFSIFKMMNEEKFANYDARREDYILSKKTVQAYVESQYQLLEKELDKIDKNYKK